MIQSHFWLGSMCGIVEQRSFELGFPTDVIAVSDAITILEDLGNYIPDNSWMLYLLEMFIGHSKIPVELNLICQFNDRDNFWAIFGGINRYKFTKVLPSVHHSYRRQITINRKSRSIQYSLSDIEEKKTERYDFRIEDGRQSASCNGIAHFTGIEWWNKAGNSPFPIRYKVEIPDLKFGQILLGRTVFKPYNVMLSNKDEYALQYPISFDGPLIKDNCICYEIIPGSCNKGLEFVVE